MRIRSLVALALVLLATPAAAQFRVPRPRVPNPVDRAKQAATDAVTPARQPTFDDRVLEMTDARLGALIRGLSAEQQQRPGLERSYKRNADERAAAEVAIRRQSDATNRWQHCLVQVTGIDTAAQRRLDQRVAAARERGDDRTAARLEDSATQAMMTRMPEIAMAQAEATKPGGKCGPAPTAGAATLPTRIVPPPRISLGDSLRVIGTGASGMTDEQYAVMRERVLAYLTTDEDDLRSSMYVFGTQELTALRAKRSELQRYQSLLVEG